LKFFCAYVVKKSNCKDAKELRIEKIKKIFASLCASAVKNQTAKTQKNFEEKIQKNLCVPLRLCG
jgi:hypothetical protein